MANKKEHRLSIRMDVETLTWIGKVARAIDRDSSWVVRWAVDEIRGRGLAPTSKTEARHFGPEAVRRTGGA
jgi:predicted transcriptional regulator